MDRPGGCSDEQVVTVASLSPDVDGCLTAPLAVRLRP